MQKSKAAIASAAFFMVAPGTVVGLVPWLIPRWEIADSTPIWQIILGGLMIAVGIVPPVHGFTQFVKAGGTPLPIAPTQRLVVTGFTLYVTHPMYLGLTIVNLGQALLFSSWPVAAWAATFWI